MNPMPAFVVAPKMVIMSPIFGVKIETRKLMVTMTNVQSRFGLLFSLGLGGKKSSSTVSLHGKIVRGVANKITTRIPKRHI